MPRRFAPSPLILSLTLPLMFAATACSAQPADDAPRPAAHPLAAKPVAIPDPPAAGSVDLPRYPSISPDGRTVAFSWRGDIWKVPAQGGPALRLTAHPGDDLASAWSPDGGRLAFNSDRTGYLNLFVMDADGTDVQQVTAEDRSIFLHDWASDGESSYLTVASYYEPDVHKEPRPYRVGPAGGPIDRLHDAFGRQPAVSPDGRYVAFVRGRAPWDRPFATNSDNRDLWLYDRQTQTFRQLTTNPGNDGKPKWLDNDTLIYQSARPPARVNLYTLDLDDESDDDATPLTSFDENVRHFDVARDGKRAVVQVWDRLYTLDLGDAEDEQIEQAQPVELAITASTDLDDRVLVKTLPGDLDEAVVSPDGKVVAVSVHGEVYIRTIDSENPPQRVTRSAARDQQLAWSPDGVKLYFVSDQDGTQSIYAATVTLTRTEIETAVKEASPVRGAFTPPDNPENPDAQAENPEAQPPAPDPTRWHDAMQFAIAPIVQTPDHDSDPSPSPDGKTLAFRRGNGDLMLLDLATGEEKLFFAAWDRGTHWVWSHDCRYLAISTEDQDHNADIWLGPVDASTPPVNITRHPAHDINPTFSADGKILTFVSYRNDGQGDLYALYLDQALETYTAQQLEDYYKQAAEAAKKLKPLPVPGKDADDKPADVAEAAKDAAEQVQLTRPEDQAEQAGEPDEDGEQQPQDEPQEKPEAEPKPKPEPLVYDLDDAYLRIRRLTSTGASEYNAAVLPGGDRVLFSRGGDLYIINWKGEEEKKLADGVNPFNLTPNGTQLALIKSGNAQSLAVDSAKTTAVAFPGSIRIDREQANAQRFAEAARALSTMFYDPTYKGMDWDTITAKYAALAQRAWTTDEFDDVANQYLGLLDASHMGIRGPGRAATNSQPNGYLGARYERVENGYKVVEVYPQTPAADGPMRLQVGDIITAIDFSVLEPKDTVPARLVGRVGQETPVTVLRQPAPAEGDEQPDAEPQSLILLITPISYNQLDDLAYDNWQRNNKQQVDAWSGGKLGYIHIKSMNATSLAEFERDLYAACAGKSGMVIDVRDNGGGWTTDRLLASIMTRRHAYTVPRGADPDRTNSYPNDRLFITRYNLPMNALCNQNSFSNAEIFSHAFKTLGRGTLVGQTTAGGVISTGSARLLDGTTIRIPFRGWYLPDGTDMENNGAVPDLMIPQTPESEVANEDPQLKAAVDDLMKRLDEAE